MSTPAAVETEIPTTAPIPSVVDLGHAGRMFLVTWLEGLVISDLPITAESWRDAWGRAADYQTVVDARAVLAVTP